MVLKAFILLVAAGLVASLFLRPPQVKQRGLVMTSSLVALGVLVLLIIYVLRALDDLWR